MLLRHYVAPKTIITLDIECGSTEPDAAIFSTSAIVHRLNQDGIHYTLSDSFHGLVNYSEISHGRTFTRRTMDWWFNDARKPDFNPSLNVASYYRNMCKTLGVDTTTHACQLAKFIMREIANVSSSEYAFFSNGPEFDQTILNHMMSMASVDFHFSGFRARSVRNAKDHVQALIAGQHTSEEEVFRRRDNEHVIEYSLDPMWYQEKKYNDSLEKMMQGKIEFDKKQFLPPKEAHCSLYDAERESRVAVASVEHYNKLARGV